MTIRFFRSNRLIDGTIGHSNQSCFVAVECDGAADEPWYGLDPTD